MNSPWDRVKDLVADALELEPSQREDYLAAACSDDPELAAEARAMLAAARDAGDFLDTPLPLPKSVQCLATGTRVGAYLIEALIGEGGFSEVYRARQEEPIRRVVALKLLKPGMDSRAVLSRFASERHTLALMSHPNIARLLDAGAMDDGRPFVVMEFVAGRTLKQHAETMRLGLRDRLALFLQVCDAVEHAHRRGVIHRDLKPSNVLVESADGSPRVKVIDFGIAKLLDRAADGAVPTRSGLLLGTPAYASPEQLGHDAADVDTRADVYALGVLLYELATGERPRGAAASLLEPHRQELVAPSRRRENGNAPAGLERIAAELDWIALKALAWDREQRYPTVDALAADLRRYLAGDAVEAGPPSRRYRLAKFARRHRVLLASALLCASALLAGGIAATIGFLRARDARDAATASAARAETALREAETVSEFLARLLSSARPGSAGKDVRVVDLLKASDRLFVSIAEFPDAQARLRRIVGQTYVGLGEFTLAEQHLREAVAILERLHGPDDWRRLEVLFALAALLFRDGRFDDGEALMEEVTTRATATRGTDHPLARELWDLRAKTAFERGRHADAAAALRGLLAADEAGGRVDAVLTTLGNLSQVLLRLGQRDEAMALATRGYELARAQHGDEHPLTIVAGRKLAAVHIHDKDYAALVAATEPLIARARAKLGPEHPDTLGLLNYLALGYQHTARPDDAERIYRELLRSHEQRLGPTHPQAMMVLNNLGTLLETRGDLPAAEDLLREAATRFRSVRGTDDLDTRLAEYFLARVVAKQGRHDEIAASFEATTAWLWLRLGADNDRARDAKRAWSSHLIELAASQRTAGRSADAVATLRKSFDACGELGDAKGRRLAATELTRTFVEMGDLANAERWRAEAR
ncbi:MAG: serine/threonine protein kinase [Planctomycetes bacterium]|nr:serine/threonine protein kinase [Planctomycetota bacterium]